METKKTDLGSRAHLLTDAHGVIFTKQDDFNNVYSPELRKRYEYDERLSQSLYYSELTKGIITSYEYFRKIGINPSDNYIRNLGFIEELEIAPEFFKFAEKLKDRFRISVVSNDAPEWRDGIVQHFGLNQYVDDYFVSGDKDIGVRKPDSGIYTAVLSKLKVNSSQCIFVEDVLENLVAPSQLGMLTIYFNRNNQPEKIRGFVPDYTVRDFRELGGLLVGATHG